MKSSTKQEAVIAVRAGQTISDAAQRMREQRVGFLVVLDDEGNGVGAVTDRDLVLRAVARRLPKDTAVREVMTSPLEEVDADSTRAQQVSRMASLGIRRLALCRDDKVVGVVSHDDLASELGADLDCLVFATSRRCLKD